MSDCSQDHKTRGGTTYRLEVRATLQIAVVITNKGRTNVHTRGLKERIVGATAKEGRDDVPTGGGEGG